MNLHDRKVKRVDAKRTDRVDDVDSAGVPVDRLKVPSEQQQVDGAAGDGVTADTAHLSRDMTRTSIVRLAVKAVLPLLVIVAAYGAYKYLVATKPETLKKPKTERAYSVVSAVAQAATYQPNLKLFGSTVTGRQVDIRALVSGRVVQTSEQLREGGEISAGDVLLTIDPFNFENSLSVAKAQLREAEARKSEFEASIEMETGSLVYAREQVQLAKKDLDRAKPLASRGAVSHRTVDDRRQVVSQRRQAADLLANNLQVWTARVAQQNATIERLKAAVGIAQRRLDETRLVAPFNAYVSSVSSHVGRLVGANDKVATLIDRDWIEARFTISDEQFGRIVSKEGPIVGRQVTVNWILGGVTFRYKGKVERLGAQVSSTSGGVEVFARLDTPLDPVPIRPGAFVEVLIPDTRFDEVFRLASTSLYFGDTVFVINDDRLAARKVKVVGGDGSDLLVRGDLKTGERVLKTRISTPGDGVLVREVDPS